MDNNSNWIVFDGNIIAAEKPVVPALSRGIMYGEGVFETLRTYSGQTLFLEKHIDRLSKGLDILGISKPDVIEVNNLRLLVYGLLQKQQLLQKDAIVRLQVWRDGQRGYLPEVETGAHFSITASVCPDTFVHPQLVTVDRKRIPSEALPSGYKFSNGINYILAAREAARREGDDALMQTVEGWISETTIANIFWVIGSTIFTPSDNCDLIPGITRNIVMELIHQNENWELQKGQFKLEHLAQADAVWICNSVRELLPVKKVDDDIFNVGFVVLEELQKQFSYFRDTHLKSLDI
jgi:branched-subunit amino acid aminotransferase/4-amino-4-deoxychorismate lyase